jgi:hypothetical protein
MSGIRLDKDGTELLASCKGDEWKAVNDAYILHKYMNDDAHTNTAESWIALLKRGIMGSFHHVSEEHLDRYANEFAFQR